jgi:hypothetical protein
MLIIIMTVQNLPQSVTSNASALAAAMRYHIVPGTFTNSSSSSGSNSSDMCSCSGNSSAAVSLLVGTYPNVTIGQTLLNVTGVVQFEGNLSQVLE